MDSSGAADERCCPRITLSLRRGGRCCRWLSSVITAVDTAASGAAEASTATAAAGGAARGSVRAVAAAAAAAATPDRAGLAAANEAARGAAGVAAAAAAVSEAAALRERERERGVTWSAQASTRHLRPGRIGMLMRTQILQATTRGEAHLSKASHTHTTVFPRH